MYLKSYITYLYEGYLRPLKWKAFVAKFKASRAVAKETLAVPPPYLIWLVIGKPDVQLFIDSGKTQLQELMIQMLDRNKLSLQNFTEILDFGCGCGRILRHLAYLPNSRIWGCDYNPVLVKWCQKNLPFVQAFQNQLTPPLPHDSNQFDFLYARSIFTHLPESMQMEWLQEFTRVLRPGGYLWITLSGDHYKTIMTPEELARYENDQLIVRRSDLAGKNECAVFHPKNYVLNKWPKFGLEFVDFQPGGTIHLAWQDCYLWRVKQSSAAFPK